MKKQYKTTISMKAKDLPLMVISGGRIGSQIKLKPEDFCKVVNGQFAQVVVGE
jgi:Cys-tRNA(Pro)/Cys-tRNA(Cys) deacylase